MVCSVTLVLHRTELLLLRRKENGVEISPLLQERKALLSRVEMILIFSQAFGQRA